MKYRVIKARGEYWQIADIVTSAVASGTNEYKSLTEYLCVKCRCLNPDEEGSEPLFGALQDVRERGISELIYPYDVKWINPIKFTGLFVL